LKVLLTHLIDELHYIEAKERSHMDAGDDGTCGFPLSTFCLIPLQLNALATSKVYHYQLSCEGNG
jgi:hypothetical protein